MKEQMIIKNDIPELAQVLNAVPGEVFSSKEAETLLIMQRRLPDSDLKEQLQIYNGIFAKQHGASIEDITASAIAYIKLKVLSENEQMDFDPKSLRNLIVECRTNIDKTTNIIRLSKTHAKTADSYQRERIESTIAKNEAFIIALEDTIMQVEKRIERMPKPLDAYESEFDFADEETKADSDNMVSTMDGKKKGKTGMGMSDLIGRGLHARWDARDVDSRLKDVEKEQADTSCVEIPFYDKSLNATEILPCKDLGCYLLLKRKDNVYFGLSRNLKGNLYNNADQSLMELTEITEDFLQFMTTDLLSDEYELHAFTDEEKKGMQMYFNFVTDCFEKHIGVTLTVAEYLSFKKYYNRLVCRVFKLEEKKHRDYYRALQIAEQYMALMDAYSMVYSETKRQIVESVIAGKSAVFVENIELIIAHHIVDEESREELELLIEQIMYFSDEEHFEKKHVNSENESPKQAKASNHPMLQAGYIPQIPIYQQGTPLIGNVYFTLQCLDENKEIIDEAFFATANMTQAMRDYANRQAFIKRIGLVQDGQFVQLMSSEEGGFGI